MPTFNYVSGNPSNLTPGGPASMTDIQGPFTDVRSAINGQLDETNVPNLTAAFTTYKEIARGFAGQTAAGVAGIYALSLGAPPATTDLAFNTANTAPWAVLLYLDPTDFNANTRTTKLRLRLAAVPQGAPAITFTAGLYPVASYGSGGAGTHSRVATLGTVVSGSTAVIASPGAGALTVQASTDFNFPAAGAYVLGVQTSGTPAANTVTDLIATLQMRQV